MKSTNGKPKYLLYLAHKSSCKSTTKLNTLNKSKDKKLSSKSKSKLY